MKFSVIMPAYNAGAYIAEAVRSVLDQSYRNLELIVVDDGSRDDTAAIVAALAQGDERLKLVVQENSGKPALARNRALELASGELVSFLDADDRYDRDRLQRIAAVFEPGVNYVIHDVSRIDTAGITTRDRLFHEDVVNVYGSGPDASGVYSIDEDFLEHFLTVSASVHTSSIVFRQSIGQLRFRSDFTCAEDLIFWVQVISIGRGVFVDEVLSCYRDTPGSVSKDQGQLDYDLYRYYALMSKAYADRLSPDAATLVRARMQRELLSAAYEYGVAGQRFTGVRLSWHALLKFRNHQSLLALLKSFARPVRREAA